MKCPVLTCIGLLLLLLLVVGVTVGVRDPYTLIHAKTADVNQGATIDDIFLTDIETGDYLGFKQFDFSGETVAFNARFRNRGHDYNDQVSLRLDSPTAEPFLYHLIQTTGTGYELSTTWIVFDRRPRGVHDLYFTFEPSGGLQFFGFNFVSLESLLPPSTTLCRNATTAIDCPPPIDCPQPVTCPSADSSVHPSESRHVSVERYDNDTRTHKYFNIYINQTLYL